MYTKEKIPVGYFNGSPEEPIKRYVFPDGNHSSGSGYHTVTKARIHQSGNNVGIEFYANYTLVDGGYDKITRVYDPAVKVAYGIVYPESETRWLKLYVGNDKAWTEFR